MTRRTLSVIGLLAGALLSGSIAADGYIVVLKDAVPAEQVRDVSQRIVESVRSASPTLRLKSGSVYRHALKGFAVHVESGRGGGLDALRADPDVAYVAADRVLELHGQLFQPSMKRIRARRNQLAAINDTLDVNVDADIAILDSGIDATHPDLFVYRSVSFLAADPGPLDPLGHGTHVAGIAAAIDDDDGIHGVAPGARLWALKVVDALGFVETSDVVAALDYVADHSAEIDVANLSFGAAGPGDDGDCGMTIGDPLHQAVCGVVDAGVVVVASAGNYVPVGQDASLISPGCYDEVVTVSAIVETDGLGPADGQGPGTIHGADNAFAGTFSNYGWDVDISAPGVDVLSTWPGGGYSTQSGTSMAAPHVAGAAALWIARYGKPADRDGVRHVRDELVRLAFPQFGADEGFSGDKETFAEPVLNAGAVDLGVFDPVEPQLMPGKDVYTYGQDTEAVVSVQLRDASGAPLDGIPSNGFLAYLGGEQREVQFQAQGDGAYDLTVEIDGMLPGDYDFTTLVSDVAGFTRSAGCRIVIQNPVPKLFVTRFRFAWPVMNADSFYTTNPLGVVLIDQAGAPVAASATAFQTSFSGGGSPLSWWPPAPNFLSGVLAAITYGAYQSVVADVHMLPPGTYQADLTVTHSGLSDSATATFDVGYPAASLHAELSSNLTVFDFTQSIAPPALDLTVRVRDEMLLGVAGLPQLVAEPLQLEIDGQTLPGVVFDEDYFDAGTYVARDVELAGLSHGPHSLRVAAVDGRGLQADSNPVTIDIVLEPQNCANPLAAAGQADADGDGYRDACDNCPAVPNPSQRNTLPGSTQDAGLGDACKSRASLRVSSDTGDNPDFVSIQSAVDAAPSGAVAVRIEILPGTGPYREAVVVDRGQSFRFVGVDLGSGPPVVKLEVPGGSLFELRSAGMEPIELRRLVLRGQGSAAGQTGIVADAELSSRLAHLSLEGLDTGLDLRRGTHVVEHITADGSVGAGVRLDDADLTLRYAEFRGTGEALRITGPAARAEAAHLLVIGDGASGCIRNDDTLSATLELRHSTLVGCGTAVRGSGAGTAISHSILWGNPSDLAGVPCVDISWSDLEDVSCGGTNRSWDPRFVAPAAGDYRLRADSPLLDHGPHPGAVGQVVCEDLAGGPRLRDHDGEGLAQVDPGAYERADSTLTPPEVVGLAWTGRARLDWGVEPLAVEYHVYRGLLSTLGYASFGACADGWDGLRTDTTLADAELPPAGDGFYYEVTAQTAAGEESSLGVGACAERSNFTPCP